MPRQSGLILETPSKRKCITCGETKPLDEFNFASRRNREKNWRRRSCKSCYRKGYSNYNLKKETRLRRFIHDGKRKSEKKGWHFDLTVEFLQKLFDRQNGKCPLTGYQMDIEGSRDKDKKPRSASLDRIDTEKGYTKDNVHFVTLQANYMKNVLSIEQLVKWCKAVIKQCDTR